MAERFFLELCRKAGLKVSASSAGVHAAAGMPLSRGAAALFAARGMAPVDHRSRRVDKEMLDAADAVYVLERAQREELLSRFPELKAKIFVLREAAGLSPADVEDPVGADAAAYDACAASIEEALNIIVRRESQSYAPNPR